MAKSFEELLSLVNARFYRSSMNMKVKDEKPTFFYHVKKTGGMSFFYATSLPSGYLNEKLPPLKQVLVHKYDNEEHKETVLAAPITNRTLIMSHLNWGAHREFNKDMHLVTMLREPFKRALSNYTYLCMRSQEPSTIEGFKAFYKKPENIDVMNKQLSATPQSIDAEATFNHLQENFRYFGTTAHITLFIEHYISEYQLPNVLMDKMNETLPEYKLDADECKAEFLALNAQDMKLYDLVSAHPRVPNKINDESNVNMITALQYEKEKTIKSLCRSHIVPTQHLFIYLSNLDSKFRGKKIVNVSEMIG